MNSKGKGEDDGWGRVARDKTKDVKLDRELFGALIRLDVMLWCGGTPHRHKRRGGTSHQIHSGHRLLGARLGAASASQQIGKVGWLERLESGDLLDDQN